MLDRTAPFLEICLQEYVNKASESLIVMFLSQGEVPAEVVCLILNANVFSAEHDTFNYGINFSWRQENHEQSHQVTQEEASLKIHLLDNPH